MISENLEQAPAHIAHRLSFMSEDHHRVRNFVVSELPRHGGEALPSDTIGQRLKLAPERCESILQELERNLFFLVRDERGAVTWAFPVTVEPTPHRLRFSNGEEIYGA